MNVSDWIAELTEERRRIEATMKPYLTRMEAIDAAIADLQRVAALGSVSTATMPNATTTAVMSEPRTEMKTSVVVSPAGASAVAVTEGVSVGITEAGSVKIMPGTGELRATGAAPLIAQDSPYWRWAVLAFDKIGHALRIPDLRRVIVALGGPEIERESLRTIVRGRPEFQSVGDGFYAVRRWPDEKKSLKIE